MDVDTTGDAPPLPGQLGTNGNSFAAAAAAADLADIHANFNATNNNNNSGSANNNSHSFNQNNGAPANNATNANARFRSGYERDVVRLIGQHLTNLGLKHTVDLLLQESGIGRLEHPAAAKFRHHILNGEWDKADKTVDDLASFITTGDIESTIKEIRFLIAEQNFLEQIEDGHLMKALKCLRSDMTPISNDFQRVQHCTSLLMCKSIDEVRAKANWAGKGSESRQDLMDKFHEYIPASIMLPPKRLSILLSQAIQSQKESCLLHTPDNDNRNEYVDLKIDHICQPPFPQESLQELSGHAYEIWYCAWSNNGKMLATGGVGGKIKIWALDPCRKRLTEQYFLECPCGAVTCLSWSPDDNYLLACGSEERPECWLLNVQTQESKSIGQRSDDDSMTTCSWHSSGELFAVGSLKGTLAIFDKDANRRGSREGVRVQCLCFLNQDPDHVLVADALKRIRIYEITNMSLKSAEEDIVEAKYPIMSFCIDKDDKYIAANIQRQGIHLWDYKTRTLLRMFSGVRERSFTIFSSFSPFERKFLASGSEDGKVYIYRPDRDLPVLVLVGHGRTANCVSWNPKFPELLASVSDDRSVRLWGPVESSSQTFRQTRGNTTTTK